MTISIVVGLAWFVFMLYNAKFTVSYNASKEIEFTSSVKLGINYMYMHCIVMNS